MLPGYEALTARYGDLHNHCDLSYGRGTLAQALQNARLQLDFTSITVHGAWPDIPNHDPHLAYLVDYHRIGFARASHNWPAYLTAMDAANHDGHFVTLPSFEWHSLRYGDHCIYLQDAHGSEILHAPDLPSLRQALAARGSKALLIPHHIGYQPGYRGIDWSAFDAELSPLVETISFHGSSESADGSIPYLHAMGPLDASGTARRGWQLGHRFGIIGSTDHHNAVPGAYGYGRVGAWLTRLDRQSLWEALEQRRTYALTGDRIELAFTVNGAIMGGTIAAGDERTIAVAVRGGSSLDYLEILHDERIIHRHSVIPQRYHRGRAKVHLEVGYGEAGQPFDWEVEVAIEAGTLVGIEPRFRGPGPTVVPPEGTDHAPHTLQRISPTALRFTTQTYPNPNSAIAAMEGVSLEVDGDTSTEVVVVANGQRFVFSLHDLAEGPATRHLGGFVSPALVVHRAIPESEYTATLNLPHRTERSDLDAYRIRVRQRNHQWAWSSPIWVDPQAPDWR